MKKIITFSIIWILVQSFALAQTNQASLNIQVQESGQRKALPQISFNLKKAAVLIASGTTDSTGKAVIPNLEPGKYILQITGGEIYFDKIEILQLVANQAKSLKISLNSKSNISLQEIAVVADKTIPFNRTDATVSGFITKAEIQALPIEGRDVTKSLTRLPNITVSTLSYNEAPSISINGLSGIYTNYLIDGLDNNERFLGNSKFNTPFGFTENITVLTNNYTAEFGNTSNGIVNLTTRSGTNKFSGEVFYVTRPGTIVDSRSAFAGVDLYGNPVKDGFQRQQLGVGLGGAIKKDKTFYYVNFEQTFDIKDNLLNSPLLGVNEAVRGNNSFSYASAKIDQYWNKNFHSSLRGNYGYFDIEQQGGGLTGGVNFPSSASTQKNRTYLIALKNDYRLSDKLKAETNFQTSWFKWNYRDNPNFGKPGVSVQGPNGSPIANIGPNDYIFIDDEYTNQLQQKFTYNTGKHTLKAGLEFTTSNFSLLGAGNSNGYYTVRLNDAQLADIRSRNVGAALDINDIPANAQVIEYRVDLDRSIFGEQQNVYNLYAEDNIALNDKLNVSLGLRFDYDNLSKAGGTKGDWNNLGPRSSFNYKLDDKNIISGGYGIYYDKIKYSVTSDNLQFSNNSENFKKQLAELQRLGILSPSADLNRITNAGNLRAIYNQGATPAYLQGKTSEESQGNRANQSSNNFRIKNPDGYQNPYSHQFTLGYQRKIEEDVLFSVDVVHTRTRNLFRIRNLNAAPSFLPKTITEIRTTTQANLDRPIPIVTENGQFKAKIGADSFGGIARDVFMTETEGRANYSAINLMLQKAKGVDDKIGYRVLYTLSRFKTDNEGINVRASNFNDYNAEYAFGDNDRTHLLTGLITWYAAKNLSLTPTILFQSGQPISYYINPTTTGGIIDLDGNGEGAYAGAGGGRDYQPGETRNNGRLPAATTFDFSAKYKLNFRNAPGIELSADIFNLLNTENLSGFSSTRAAGNQIQLGSKSLNTLTKTGAAPPRQFQFGVRYLFN